MSNIHVYSSEILCEVEVILAHIYQDGGKISKKFLISKAAELKGRWAADTINIAMAAMDLPPCFQGGKASETQMNIFVEQAKKHNEELLGAIAKLRAEKGK